jgi:hypothetical protein
VSSSAPFLLKEMSAPPAGAGRQLKRFYDNMLAEREQQIFAAHPGRADPGAVFVLAAPRTGSTVLYQALADSFALPVISNHTNAQTPQHPVLGILASHEARLAGNVRVDYTSRYGKTEGGHGLSEGSAVFKHWCGGGHPSEIQSPGVLPERAAHMRATLAAVADATGKPLLTKNAWNCFRLADLARRFPETGFIWLRRDVRAAAESDLAARYAVQGDAHTWNSATPANVDELRRLPPEGQVLENQYEFSRAISQAAEGLAPDRFAEVWYEDFIAAPDAMMRRLAAICRPLQGLLPAPLPEFSSTRGAVLSEAERAGISARLAQEPARWQPLRWRTPQ